MVIFYCGFPLKIACGLLTTETIKEIARVRQFSNDDIFHIVYKIRFKAYRCESIYILFLKEVFAKNERGYRLPTNNKRFWSLLILQFSQFGWMLRYSVWAVFNNYLLIDATDRSKISSHQKRLFLAVCIPPLNEHSL